MSTFDRPKNELHKTITANDDLERELLVFQAQLCEQACRFDDMVEVIKKLCQTYDDLSNHERDLLSCAYKNIIGSRRSSWRVLNEIINSTTTNGSNNGVKPATAITSASNNFRPEDSTTTTTTITNDAATNDDNSDLDGCRKKLGTKYDIAIVRDISLKIESELNTHCGNIIDILNNRLITSNSATGESKVFYYKMKGDYLRYLCEISLGPERKERSNESLLAYKIASDKAMVELPPTHPVRLGLMLNISVFYYDILKSSERSCRLAKQAFDDAIAELDTLSEESYRESTIIMQLLRDNLNLWELEQDMHVANEVNQ